MPQRDLVAELRSARTPAPAELRERVRLIAAADASPRPRVRVTRRRVLAVALPLAAAVAAAAVALTRPGGHHAGAPHVEAFRAATAAPSAKLAPAVPATALTLREPDAPAVALAARRAQAIVVSLSGYATAVEVHGTRGRLVLHVPPAKAPRALARLRALGTVTGTAGPPSPTIELRLRTGS